MPARSSTPTSAAVTASRTGPRRKPMTRFPAVFALLAIFILGWGAAAPGMAEDPAEEALRQFIEALDVNSRPFVAGEQLQDPRGLSAFYTTWNHEYVWTRSGPLSGQLNQLLEAIRESAGHGLHPHRYHAETLQQLLAEDSSDSNLTLELLATDAFLAQANHRSSGAVSPHELDADWHLVPPEIDAVGLLAATAGQGNAVREVLTSLWPTQREYWDLVSERARIEALHEEDTVRIPDGALLKPGQTGERVRLLQARLLGPNDHSGFFDESLRQAVQTFQRAAGLNADGIVGPSTLEMLNANRFSWIERIDANLERWRWLPRKLPDTFLSVNIPAFTLQVVQDGRNLFSMDVIVGRTYRRTPVFSADMRYLVVNPYWNVPFKLAVQDKLPHLQEDPAALAAQGFEIRSGDGTGFIPVDRVDWHGVTHRNFPYALRQKPGPLNALGQVKFMLPNPYAVYLHDTPSRELFEKQERSFSSGCIRLSEPVQLARWLLTRDGQAAEAAQVETLIASGETLTLHLTRPVPVFLVYFTAFTDRSGTVVFRRDLYERDAPIVAALRGESGNLDEGARLLQGA